MSESETPSTELVVPGLGSVVDLNDAAQVAITLDDIRDLESQFRYIKAELTRALVHASEVQGTKTLHLPGATVTVKSGESTVYDAEEIELGLRAAGMPDDRIKEIVKETVSYSVAAVKAKQAAAANPRYAEVIDAHKSQVTSSPSVSISRTKTS